MSEQASGNFISVSERLKRFKPASGRRTVKHSLSYRDQKAGSDAWRRTLCRTYFSRRKTRNGKEYLCAADRFRNCGSRFAGTVLLPGDAICLYGGKNIKPCHSYAVSEQLPDRGLVSQRRKQYRETERLETGRKGGKRDQRQF